MSDQRTTDEQLYATYCPDCGANYTTSVASEVDHEDRLCPKCFDAWNGATIEELLRP